MASDLGIVEKLQQEFCRCAICFEEYDENTHIPRMLPCQHTFCSECLKRQCSKTKIKCPNCNQEYPTKNRNIQIFPKDITRSNLVDFIGKDKTKKDHCEICSRADIPLLSCRECNIHFCQMCRKSQEEGGCRDHAVLDQYISYRSPCSKSSICLLEGHEHNELKLYCESRKCLKPICANCVVQTHKDHNYVPITQVYESKKMIMIERQLLTKAKIKVAKKIATELKSEMSRLQDSRSSITSFLEHSIELGLQFLNKQKTLITRKHSKLFDKNMQHLESRHQTLNNFMENANECCTVSDEALSKYDMVKFLSFEKLISEKLDTFNSFEFEEKIESVEAECQALKSEVSNLNEKIVLMTQTNISTKSKGHMPPMKDQVHWLIRDSYLLLRNNIRNRLTTCLSKDRTFSNVPLVGTLQQCQDENKLYVYKGIFVNKTLDTQKDFMDIKIGLRDIKVGRIDGKPLIEFGISSGSLHGRNLDSFYQADVYGWYISFASEMKLQIVNTLNNVVYNVHLQFHSNEVYLKLRVQLSAKNNVFLVLLENNDNRVILDHQIFQTRIRGSKFVFVSLWDNPATDPSVRLLHKGTVFNDTTADSNIKLSSNKKQISIKKADDISKQVHMSNTFVSFENCTKTCFYSLRFTFENTPSTYEGFHVYFDQENQVIGKTTLYLFSFAKCYISNFIGKRKLSTCLLFNSHLEGYEYFVEVLPKQWHRILFFYKQTKA